MRRALILTITLAILAVGGRWLARHVNTQVHRINQ